MIMFERFAKCHLRREICMELEMAVSKYGETMALSLCFKTYDIIAAKLFQNICTHSHSSLDLETY